MAGRHSASATIPVAVWILAALAAVWFLRAAATLLIPIAVAILISYALESLPSRGSSSDASIDWPGRASCF